MILVTLVDLTNLADLTHLDRYPCASCGACCKKISHLVELQAYDDGSGRCIYLGEDNLCRIYATRPEVCNGELVYRKYFRDIPKDQFYKEIQGLCARLRKCED